MPSSRVPPSFEFVAPQPLRHGHWMTLAATLWPRRFPALPPAEPRLVAVAPDTQVRLDCHWQRERAARPTLLLVHGLEGSSQSHYVLGTAEKAWRVGFSAVRLNVRNCGGTERFTPALYHSGLSSDIAAVVEHLRAADHLQELHLAGFSMGGNMVLKLAGEWGVNAPRLVRSVAAISPSLDLAACADAMELPDNLLYQWQFLSSLKARLRRKARLFPALYSTDGLWRIGSVRQFDERFTAPHFGFGTAANYYAQASALRLADRIALPTLILAAEDDPFIPIESFRSPALTGNPHITLLTPAHGGHVGFLSRAVAGEDRYWAENRIIDFCQLHSSR